MAWDTRGNAYLTCLFFDRGAAISQNPDESSAFYVFRSTGTGGASWNFPGRPVAEFSDPAAGGAIFLDKELMAIDDHRQSPFRDRIYVSWTRFASDGTAYIFLAYSRDYGESFSSPRLVSRDSALCVNTAGVPTPLGRCSVNQFSQPFTGPDGTLYVTWANYNVTAPPSTGDNRSQMLAGAFDRRRQHVLGAGQGRRLLRPARLRDLPGRQRFRQRLRTREGRDDELVLPRRQLPGRGGRRR